MFLQKNDNYLHFSKFIITLLWVLIVSYQTTVLGDKTDAVAVRNRIYYLEDFGGIPDSQFFGHDASTYEAFPNTLFSDHPNNSKKSNKSRIYFRIRNRKRHLGQGTRMKSEKNNKKKQLFAIFRSIWIGGRSEAPWIPS